MIYSVKFVLGEQIQQILRLSNHDGATKKVLF